MVDIVEEVSRFKALKWEEEGKLSLWGIPCVLFPVFTITYLGKLLEYSYGEESAKNILYNLGYTQAKQAVQLVNKRFGYTKTIRDKRKLLEFNTGQIALAGHGLFKWSRIDAKNRLFIVRGKSSVAEEYKRLFGIQKRHVDHFKRGEFAAGIEEIFGIKVLPVEKECIGVGNKECVTICKPLGDWDKNDPLVKEQMISRTPTLKELNAVRELYHALPK